MNCKDKLNHAQYKENNIFYLFATKHKESYPYAAMA